MFGLVIAVATIGRAEPAPVKLTVEPGHTWTAPFGVDRVGRPLEAVVEVPGGANTADEYAVRGYRNGVEVSRRAMAFLDQNLSDMGDKSGGRFRFARVVLEDWPTEVALWLKQHTRTEWAEIARVEVKAPRFEADAEVRPDKAVNPVDLGAIFPPANWLLLAGGQKAEVDVAAVSRDKNAAGAKVSAWYESQPAHKTSANLAMEQNGKVRRSLPLGPSSRSLTQDTLHVVIVDGADNELWRKEIHVMLVPESPKWPAFGVVQTKLRYDAGIPLPDGKTLDYKDGWDPKFNDTVVVLPNGGRFVFWRGSCNIPFWAGRDNTGFCYEWAERVLPGPWGEPLMDRELKYSQVEIVESTEARVHVRWLYRAVGMHDEVTGDTPVEDYYFYPDGFGTRVMTLTCVPEAVYELNEFIPITPVSGYPLRMFPANMLDLLWIDGDKAAFELPFIPGEQGAEVAKAEAKAKGSSRTMPKLGDIHLAVPTTPSPIYRVRIGKPDALTVIQYNPSGWGPTWPGNFLPGLFGPQNERGAIITRAYWGFHWPLSRDGGAGASDKDRIDISPAHNSIVTSGWTAAEGDSVPAPIRRERLWMRDGNGELKRMRRDTFAWLIGMTDATDDDLRLRAQSYSEPPSIQVKGAEVDSNSYYAQDRRALCLTMSDSSRTVGIKITPKVPCVDPVFEIQNAPKTLECVLADGERLDRTSYAWDGRTLWMEMTVSHPVELQLDFGKRSR